MGNSFSTRFPVLWSTKYPRDDNTTYRRSPHNGIVVAYVLNKDLEKMAESSFNNQSYRVHGVRYEPGASTYYLPQYMTLNALLAHT